MSTAHAGKCRDPFLDLMREIDKAAYRKMCESASTNIVAFIALCSVHKREDIIEHVPVLPSSKRGNEIGRRFRIQAAHEQDLQHHLLPSRRK